MRRTFPSFLNSRLASLAILLLSFNFSFSACAKRSRSTFSTNDQQTFASATTPSAISQPRININTAASKELETLPGIGKGLAERIIEHREKYGPFRRVEHLIVVRGISERRFRALRDLIIAE